MPGLDGLDALEDFELQQPAPVEKQQLLLPSDFPTEDMRASLSLQDLARCEYRMREGQAYDALNDIRAVIRRRVGLLQQRKRRSSGQAQKTRSRAQMNRAQKALDRAADRYSRARRALLRLGLSEDDETFRALDKKTDLRALQEMEEEEIGLGHGRDELSWIWRVGQADEAEEDDEYEGVG